MTKRQEAILRHIVELYIEKGEPVSSLALAGDFGFSSGESAAGVRPSSLSSAMLRIEMVALEEAGWLEQPHTSSGRVPTMKAMRWFARAIMAQEQPRQVVATLENPQELTDRVSRSAITAAVFVAEPEGKMALSGLQYLADASEIFDQELVSECLLILEMLVKKVEDLFETVPEGHVILYVGDENPLVPQHHFSMLMGRMPEQAVGPGILALMGPLRMDYSRAISVLKGFVIE